MPLKNTKNAGALGIRIFYLGILFTIIKDQLKQTNKERWILNR